MRFFLVVVTLTACGEESPNGALDGGPDAGDFVADADTCVGPLESSEFADECNHAGLLADCDEVAAWDPQAEFRTDVSPDGGAPCGEERHGDVATLCDETGRSVCRCAWVNAPTWVCSPLDCVYWSCD